MRACTECDQQAVVEEYEAVLKDVLEAFSGTQRTPRENSELEWEMTDSRIALLARIRTALEAKGP